MARARFDCAGEPMPISAKICFTDLPCPDREFTAVHMQGHFTLHTSQSETLVAPR